MSYFFKPWTAASMASRSKPCFRWETKKRLDWRDLTYSISWRSTALACFSASELDTSSLMRRSSSTGMDFIPWTLSFWLMTIVVVRRRWMSDQDVLANIQSRTRHSLVIWLVWCRLKMHVGQCLEYISERSSWWGPVHYDQSLLQGFSVKKDHLSYSIWSRVSHDWFSCVVFTRGVLNWDFTYQLRNRWSVNQMQRRLWGQLLVAWRWHILLCP